jgi:putative ABC transport system permease protein
MNKVCVVDKRTAEELGTEDLVGKQLKLGDINFLVVGVCENGDRWEGASVLIPLSTHQAIYSTNHHFDHISLTADLPPFNRTGDPTEMSPFEQKVHQLLAPVMQFDPKDHRAVGVWSQQEMYDQQQGAMTAIRLFVLIIGICTLISGAVGVSNIMLVSVRERTKEFGIRKAIGAPPSTILTTVVGESIFITALFGYIGLFFGIGVMELVNMLVPEGDFPFRNPTVDLGVVTIATLFLIIVGVIAGAIPAVRAMRIKPIEALNYEK